MEQAVARDASAAAECAAARRFRVRPTRLRRLWKPGLTSAADGVAVIHVAAQVGHVVGDAGTQAQVAHAVVACRVLPAGVAHPDDRGPRVECQNPHLRS